MSTSTLVRPLTARLDEPDFELTAVADTLRDASRRAAQTHTWEHVAQRTLAAAAVVQVDLLHHLAVAHSDIVVVPAAVAVSVLGLLYLLLWLVVPAWHRRR